MVESSKQSSVWSRNQKTPANPFELLKRQKGKVDLGEIKDALNTFDCQRFNVSDFIAACITSLQELGSKQID